MPGIMSLMPYNVSVINTKATIAAISPCPMNIFKKGFIINPSVAPTSCMLLTVKRRE